MTGRAGGHQAGRNRTAGGTGPPAVLAGYRLTWRQALVRGLRTGGLGSQLWQAHRYGSLPGANGRADVVG